MRRTALLAAGLAATLVLSLSVAAAGQIWEYPRPVTAETEISRSFTFEGGLVRVICQVTLVKTIHQLIEKERGTLWGLVTEATATGCRHSLGAEAQVSFLGLPWHITYESFAGELPNITAILVIMRRAQVLMTIGGSGCLYEGDVPLRKDGEHAPGEINIEALTTLDGNMSDPVRILRQELLFPCPTRIEWRGTFTFNEPIRIVRF